MAKKVGLLFPLGKADKPVISDLVKIYDIDFNILQSSIIPGQTGRMVIDLSGDESAINDGLEFLRSQGLKVFPLSQSVIRLFEKCVDCGACTSVCPSGALSLDGEHKLHLDDDKCLLCNACITACPMRALHSGQDIFDVET